MMTLLEVEASVLLSRYVVKGLEESRRRGEFWLTEEVARSLKKGRSESPGLRGRVLTRIGDFLVWFGLRLKGWGRSDSPAAVLQVD